MQDAHQGRGIGNLLLEHLAQAGRERGIDKFVADVLPENRRMIQTFRDAGYQVDGGFTEGVMRVVFRIDPTDTSVNVMQAREHRAEAASIQRFFDAKSVAVIGASRRHDTIGQTLVRNLVLGDYQGRVYVVNPAATSVAGLPSYPTVAAIPDSVEVAIVAVPADAVHEVVLDCAAKGVHGLVVISSGFAETGDEGRRRQRQLVGLARSYGLRIVGPNALGIINTHGDYCLNASLSTLPTEARPVSWPSRNGELADSASNGGSRRRRWSQTAIARSAPWTPTWACRLHVLFAEPPSAAPRAAGCSARCG